MLVSGRARARPLLSPEMAGLPLRSRCGTDGGGEFLAAVHSLGETVAGEGDLLVTSSTPGHAMRGSRRKRMLGAVLGKALEPLEKGTGTIGVLVVLQ